jgi:hypothetical protein
MKNRFWCDWQQKMIETRNQIFHANPHFAMAEADDFL